MSTKWFTTSSSGSRANFCPLCGGLPPLPDRVGSINCKICNYSWPTTDFEGKPVKTASRRREDVEKLVLEDTAALITDHSVLCPKCDHHEIAFKTAQMRSADEGQTIFYECNKCKYSWTVNA